MKKIIVGIVSCLAIAGWAVSSDAALVDRGGGMIYDSDQDLTWLQDANYAMTSGFDTDGRMTRNEAVNWATNLVYEGLSGWRLPEMIDIGLDGCNQSFVGGTDCGFNVDTTGNELAYMYHNNLGNIAMFNSNPGPNLCPSTPNACLTNKGPFTNLGTSGGEANLFWFGPPVGTSEPNAWWFGFATGEQQETFGGFNASAWAVRNGDVASVATVPIPAAAWLFGSGLVGLIGLGRTKRTA